MASAYWTIREKVRLNPVVSRSIYILQSLLYVFSEREFSTKVKLAAKSAAPAGGVALCVRIRDEAPDLREFVEYYLAAGVSQIFFYEARSVDNFREVLEPFIAAGFVTLIDNWPHIPISPAAEHDCILRCIGRYGWMGCIDADEFVVVRNMVSIPDFLNQVPKRYPAVGLHWRLYGSNGRIKRPNLPVILAYSRRQKEANLHVKVFVRPDRVRFHRNPHSWYYRGIFSTAVNEKNRRIWGSTSVPPADDLAWINHYYHKSKEEFDRKARRVNISDRVGIQFNSRTPERGADFERTANEMVDLAAVDYHRGLCRQTDCSICAAISSYGDAAVFEHAAAPETRDNEGASIHNLTTFAKKTSSTVTVVICTRLRPAALRKCLIGITRLERTPDEVIIVDNTLGDKETEDIAREFSAAYLIEPAVGLSRARNRGLDASKSEIVAYLDDDALPDEDWLQILIEPFEDPRVGVVTGGIILPKSSADDSSKGPNRFLSNDDPKWFEIAAYGGLGIGTNMALRKAACEGWDVFDERLGRGAPFQGMEEHHAFARLLSRSYSAVHVPAAIVFHSSPNTTGIDQDPRTSFAYWMLLFAEFPGHRLDLVRFLFRRLSRKPLTWPRAAPDPGGVLTSGWRALIKASFVGTLLYMRSRKRQDK